MTEKQTAAQIVERCERLYADLALDAVRAWKEKHPGKPAIGHLPVYAPRELVDAMGGLPVSLWGGGDQIDIVKGDASFQSYICHIPRSTLELGLQGDLDLLDGTVFPSTCDVIRNLSGISQILFPGKLARYVDLPQSLDQNGAEFYRKDLQHFAAQLEKLGGDPLTPERLAASIERFNANRRALRRLYDRRAEAPWLVPADECYLVLRASGVLPVEEHTALVEAYLAAAAERGGRKEDRIRVVIVGAFCEQPPLGLLRTLDRSGCYVVDDDLALGVRFVEGDVDPGADPLDALARAYVEHGTWASTRYEADAPRGELLVKRVKARRADGVVFAAPSFCDPALLDQPPLQKALTAANIPFISFKYAENNGQFQGIREQAGTFSDSIKLWGEA